MIKAGTKNLMQTYNINSVKQLAQFLILNYQKEFENLLVITQSGLACKFLQKAIIEESEICTLILPEIVPFLSQENIDISRYFDNVILPRETKLIFAKILLKNNFVKDFASALNLADPLINLYHEFIFNNIELKNIKFLFTYDLSEQSYKNISIIDNIFHDYESYQKNKKKIDIGVLQKKQLLDGKLYKDNKKIVLGFLEPDSNVVHQFIQKTLDNGGINIVKGSEEILKQNNNISAIELENEFHEAKYLSNLCRANDSSKILIVSDNIVFNNLLTINLQRENLEYSDYTYSRSKQDNFLDLAVNIADFCLNNFDIKKLLLIMKSPLLIDNSVYEIECNILRKEIHISDFKSLLKNVESKCLNESYLWFRNFYEKISKVPKTVNNDFIELYIHILKEICKNINLEQYNEYFDLLKQLPIYFDHITNNDYIAYLKYIQQNYFISIKDKDSNIIISKVKDADLISDVDIIIIPSFTSNYWPNKKLMDILLNDSMKLKIGIPKSKEEKILDKILQLIGNRKAYITFPKKFAGEIVTKSKYLNLIKSSRLVGQIQNFNKIDNSEKSIKFCSRLMPDKISSTNVEMLIRNPYGFYAKHILKLRPKNPPIAELKLSEFGNFIHLILEKYTKNYNLYDDNKLDGLIHLSNSIYSDLNKELRTPLSWLYKFKKIAKSFIEFDEKRRLNLSEVMPETYGEMDIVLSNRIVKITAIADRIEINKNNEIFILDYKTGTVPTIKSVNQGLSPQLILEALIAKYGYFEKLNSKDISKIIYVKIASSEPYFMVTEIEINDEILRENLEHFKKFLKYYYDNKEIEISKSKLEISPDYNDYLHIIRESEY